MFVSVAVSPKLELIPNEVSSRTVIPVKTLTSNLRAACGRNVVHDDMALRHVIAVATRTVHLAEVVDREASNRKGSTTIMLKHLVFCSKSSATIDRGCLIIALLLDGEGIFTYCRPPDVRKTARPFTVDTFNLVWTDDAVGKAGTVLEHEHSVAVSAFFLSSAVYATIVHHHTAVEGLACCNGLDRGECR